MIESLLTSCESIDDVTAIINNIPTAEDIVTTYLVNNTTKAENIDSNIAYLELKGAVFNADQVKQRVVEELDFQQNCMF